MEGDARWKSLGLQILPRRGVVPEPREHAIVASGRRCVNGCDMRVVHVYFLSSEG